MTGGNLKSRQKRLDSCVLARPKWTKIRETHEKPTCGTLKIDDLTADAAVRVENVHENGQARGNTKLLGKYQLKSQVLTQMCVPFEQVAHVIIT